MARKTSWDLELANMLSTVQACRDFSQEHAERKLRTVMRVARSIIDQQEIPDAKGVSKLIDQILVVSIVKNLDHLESELIEMGFPVLGHKLHSAEGISEDRQSA